jgi:hypothetical protein
MNPGGRGMKAGQAFWDFDDPPPCPSLLLPFAESLMRLIAPVAITLAERGVTQSVTLKTNPGGSAAVALTCRDVFRTRAAT